MSPSSMLISNKAFSKRGQIFSDDVLATALLDRLLQNCDVVPITGARIDSKTGR